MTTKRLVNIFSMLTLFWALASTPLLAQRGSGHGGGMGPSQGMPQMPGRPEMGGQHGSRVGNPPSGETMKTTPAHPEGNVGADLSDHTALSAKLQNSLPAGTNLQEASAGFKNMGQFVASVNVSHNLDIPFDQLKVRMVSGKSLGDAIHALKPTMSSKEAKIAAQKAQKNAEEEIKDSKRASEIAKQQAEEKEHTER